MGGWSVIVPEATTNLCTNPSFETNTTGWSASGTNTIARSTAVQRFGAYSLLCTYQSSTTLATYAVGSGDLSTSTTYTVTVRLYVPAGWDGGDIRITAANFTGATVTQVREWDSATGDTAVWVELETTLAITSDAVGDIQIATTTAPTAGKTIYIDALQIEAKAYATTYCDGDRPGCSWAGTPHATTSSRSATERSGGRVQDIQSDWGIQVRNWFGVGTPPITLNSYPLPQQDGSLAESTRFEPRIFSLSTLFNESDAVSFHSVRQKFIRAVASRLELVGEPVQASTLRYTGKSEPIEIRGRYAGGLELPAPKQPYFEELPVRFKADDPFFYQVGEKAVALDTNDSETFSYVGRRINGAWDNMGAPTAGGPATISVSSIVADDTYVYFGGKFENFAGIANADYIVRYEKSSGNFSALGTGMNDTVGALAIGPDGNLYAGGTFTTAGGSSITGLAKWNGSSWSAVGGAVSGTYPRVYALAFSPDGWLYAGGTFSGIGVATSNCIAKYTLATGWQNVAGSGCSNPWNIIPNVRSIAVNKDGLVYAVGDFKDVRGVTGYNGIFVWDNENSTESMLSTGFNIEPNRVFVASDNSVYIGGIFATAGGVTVNKITKWNGTAFESLDTGITGGGVVTSISEDRAGSIVVCIADNPPATAGGIDITLLAGWNGSTWYPIDATFTGSGTASGLYLDGDVLYIGYDNTAAIPHSGLVSVLYDGTARSYPKIVINRSGGTSAKLVSLRNETTGAILYCNYDLDDGETLTIDLRPRSGISVTSSVYGNVPSAILPNSHMGQFYLAPGVSSGRANDISCFIDTAGSPTITANLFYKDTFLSID